MVNEVLLRNVLEDDLPIFFVHQQDPLAYQMAAFNPREWQPFLAHWKKIIADDQIIKRTILLGGQVAGNLVCFDLFGKREVGYWLGREFWKKGIATRALAIFLPAVAYRPLFAHVIRHNIASQHVLEKCGFRQCGEEAEEIIFRLDHD
jgi:RimJ/RimL family protein N-acetyltransferase